MANFAIDYTSRDFDSLKKDLIALIQTRLSANNKTWEANDPADFGLALVEAFAYVGDITNYYIDRVANESYLPTAVQRSSVLKLAKGMNYSPAGFIQAVVDLSVTNSIDSALELPKGTQFSVEVPLTSTSSTRLLFSTTSDISILASSNGTTQVELVHGEEISLKAENRAANSSEIDGEYLTKSSNGFANQSYVLLGENPVDSTIEVFVENNGTYILWTRVNHLYDYGPTDTVYEVSVNDDNSATILFGDGVSGAAPSFGSEIKATYSIVPGGGAVGNVPAGLTTWQIIAVPSFTVDISTLSGLTFINPDPGFGGSDPESNASIRENAPRALTAANRAVTIDDFASLALSVSGVGGNKAAAYAISPNSVAVYAAPQNGTSSTSFYPGFDENNVQMTDYLGSLLSSVESFFAGKLQIGTSVTVLPPVYVPVNLVVKAKTPTGVDPAVTLTSILREVFNAFGYDQVTFNLPIFPENIEQALTKSSVASLVKVVSLYLDGASEARTVLSLGQGQIPIFSDQIRESGRVGVEIYPWASLRGLTLSSGTLSPAFNTLVTGYTTTTTGSSVTVTPVKVDATDVVTMTLDGAPSVDGVVAFSGVGTKTLSVTVTSADATESKTYTVAITKTA